ncbi:MAG: hypothetical protein JWM77_1576 [Rhodospirillales bacterium]|nr:hypothetical protein [Rhodospirillales bacterium]
MHWIDSAGLPETHGTVERFLLNPKGDADGLMLDDGTEVHFPPHMGAALCAAVQPGSRVLVRGVRPRGVVKFIAAVSVVAEDGIEIIDNGPPAHDKKPAKKPSGSHSPATTVEGVVLRPLHGPKGEVRGVLFEDGRSGRFPPHAAAALDERLKPGARLALRGEARTTVHGTVVHAHEIGTNQRDLRPIEKKPKPHDPEDEHPPHKRGPKHHPAH